VSNSGVWNYLVGDSIEIYDSAQAGNDTLIGGSNSGGGFLYNGLYGDAGDLYSSSARPGDDTLIGGSNTGSGHIENSLYADAPEYDSSAQGGDDTLTGGSNSGSGSVTNNLYGDGYLNNSGAQGGNDVLISGVNATDYMWGDWRFGGTGGADTFVFKDAFGTDYIYDFDQAENDLMQFQVAGVASFDDLTIAQSGSNTVVTTSASTEDSVTLVNYDNSAHPLTAHDFWFV
jgi:hypothetical protein